MLVLLKMHFCQQRMALLLTSICAVADDILNTGYTIQYASPQIVAHVGTCPKIRGDKADMWALGVLMHTAITCASPAWHPAFDPMGDDGQGLPAADTEAAEQTRVLKHQQEWVCLWSSRLVSAAFPRFLCCIPHAWRGLPKYYPVSMSALLVSVGFAKPVKPVQKHLSLVSLATLLW